jgi:hypothetical protein
LSIETQNDLGHDLAASLVVDEQLRPLDVVHLAVVKNPPGPKL